MARGLFVALAALVVIAVSGSCKSNADCTCPIDSGGEHRVIGCGDRACVGGVEFTCTDGTASGAGGCTEPPPSSSGSSGEAPPDSGTPEDHSCQDLQSFCDTSCRKPASVNSDCLSTASSGDPTQCAAWQSSNAVLCSP